MKKEYDFSKGVRGPIVSKDPNKVEFVMSLDYDILNYFKKKWKNRVVVTIEL